MYRGSYNYNYSSLAHCAALVTTKTHSHGIFSPSSLFAPLNCWHTLPCLERDLVGKARENWKTENGMEPRISIMADKEQPGSGARGRGGFSRWYACSINDKDWRFTLGPDWEEGCGQIRFDSDRVVPGHGRTAFFHTCMHTVGREVT